MKEEWARWKGGGAREWPSDCERAASEPLHVAKIPHSHTTANAMETTVVQRDTATMLSCEGISNGCGGRSVTVEMSECVDRNDIDRK